MLRFRAQILQIGRLQIVSAHFLVQLIQLVANWTSLIAADLLLS